MARRKRDYKAEYQAAKRRATNAGYRSEREYKAVRKELNLPRSAGTIPKRVLQQNTDLSPRQTAHDWAIRRENAKWSREHSRRASSRYRDSMSSTEAEKYYRAFVEPVSEKGKAGKRRKRERLRDYLAPDDDRDAETWYQAYVSSEG